MPWRRSWGLATVREVKGQCFLGEFGVFSAKTVVQLSATGLAGGPRFQQNLQQERRELLDKADLSRDPVLGLGLIYRFWAGNFHGPVRLHVAGETVALHKKPCYQCTP
ncbi:MAG: hypothetical protein ACOH1V_06535 [Stenotrophomonas sp.]